MSKQQIVYAVDFAKLRMVEGFLILEGDGNPTCGRASPYNEGWKRCKKNAIWIKTERLRCPFCHNLLRGDAHHKTHRRRRHV